MHCLVAEFLLCLRQVDAPLVRSSDQAHDSLNKSFSTAQTPAPKLPDRGPSHAGSSSAALPVDVAVVLFCYDRYVSIYKLITQSSSPIVAGFIRP